mmetsp:Transcript_10224/g.20483  ORF Transcript_10224/g.20483 Transcript_10224/m.20483 type:complete len:280 (-) Transcript_10224:224-1063(-)
MDNPFKALWHFYSASLQRRPLGTKMVAAVFIFTTSDLATQYITYRDDVSRSRRVTSIGKRRRVDDSRHDDDDQQQLQSFAFNIQRAFSASSFGVIGTIYLHNWWNFLERFVNARFPIIPAKRTSRLSNALVKVMIDQSISAPLYNWCYFFITNAVHSSNAAAGGDRVGAAASKATDMIGPLMLSHWKIWPPIHAVNFYFTPVQNRVLVQNLVLVGWSGYLSHLNHSREEGCEVVVEEVLRKESDETRQVPAVPRIATLKRHKTIVVTTGIDIAEVDVEE